MLYCAICVKQYFLYVQTTVIFCRKIITPNHLIGPFCKKIYLSRIWRLFNPSPSLKISKNKSLSEFGLFFRLGGMLWYFFLYNLNLMVFRVYALQAQKRVICAILEYLTAFVNLNLFRFVWCNIMFVCLFQPFLICC